MLSILKCNKVLSKLTILGCVLVTLIKGDQNTLGPFFLPKDNFFHDRKQDIAWILTPQNTSNPEDMTVNDASTKTPFQALLKNKSRLYKALDEPQGPAPGKDEPFNFLVYGNLAIRENSSSQLIAQKTFNYIQTYLAQSSNLTPALHLLTGNLVRQGNSSNQLLNFFTMAQPVLGGKRIASALGSRELYDQETKDRKKKVYTIPLMANFWHLTKPIVREKWFKTTNALSQRSFTIGSARFIHLPIIDQVTVDGHPEIVHDFIAQVRQAHHEKHTGNISFIIIYTHIAPITHPQYTHRYTGLFEQYDQTNKSKLALNNAIQRIEKCFETYAVDAIFAGHNRIFSRVHWGTNRFKIPVITMGIGTRLDQLDHNITISAQSSLHGYNISGEKLFDRNSFQNNNTKQDILGFLKTDVDPKTKTMTLTLFGTPYSPNKSNTNYTILDSLVINARAAQKIETNSYTVNTPLDLLGPFFIPTNKPNFYDVFMVHIYDKLKTNITLNNIDAIFQTPLTYHKDEVNIVSKFLNVPLNNGAWEITQNDTVIAQGSIIEPTTNEPFHINICGDTRATFDDEYDVYEQLMNYIKQYEETKKQQAVMLLNTGDLISFGGIDEHWKEFFHLSNDWWQGRLIHAALGNHELYADNNNIYTRMTPYFANIFYSKSWNFESEPSQYLNQTTTWFDVGPVRFLHLPYVQPDFISGMDPDPIDIFIENVKKTNDELNSTSTHLKYIVWLTHRPFIGVKSKYKPLFTDKRDGYPQITKKLQAALDAYPPSGIFFGHQHYYFSATYINKNGVSIPTITIGTGTTLNEAGKPFEYTIGESKVLPHVRYAKQDYPTNLVSFVDCAVLYDRMVCRLIGAPHDKNIMPIDYTVLDTLACKPAKLQKEQNDKKS